MVDPEDKDTEGKKVTLPEGVKYFKITGRVPPTSSFLEEECVAFRGPLNISLPRTESLD